LYSDLAGCCVHLFTTPEPLAEFLPPAKTTFAIFFAFR
jgi:hypothetical protein